MKKKILRSLLAILVISFLTSVVFLTVSLVRQRQELRKKAAEYVASLVLVPTKVDVVLADPFFDIRVVLNPGGQEVMAVDAILNFDKNLLELTEIAPNLGTNFKTFTPVLADGSFDKEKVKNQANSDGKLKFGAVTFDWGADQTTNPVRGVVNPLATISFKAKAEGTSTVSFGFEALGATTDANVVKITGEEAIDILKDPSGNTVEVTITSAAIPTPTLPCDGSEAYTAYGAYTFTDDRGTHLQQSIIDKNGQDSWYRTCPIGSSGPDWDKCSDWSFVDLSNLRGVGNEAYGSYGAYTFSDASGIHLQQSLIDTNGQDSWYRTCPIGASGPEWAECSDWSFVDLSNLRCPTAPTPTLTPTPNTGL